MPKSSQSKSATPIVENPINCKKCSRLATFLADVKKEHPNYFCKPVPPFGVANPKLLIVGLAPGKHGANATGRPFTGDYAGILLYETLYKYGFSTKPQSIAIGDGLKLKKCRITNAVKCLPPENKPLPAEVNECNKLLLDELLQLKPKTIVMALGGIAHKSVIKAFELKQKDYPFGHATQYQLPNKCILISSYHCSKYNTSTKRLTEAMFHKVFDDIASLMA